MEGMCMVILFRWCCPCTWCVTHCIFKALPAVLGLVMPVVLLLPAGVQVRGECEAVLFQHTGPSKIYVGHEPQTTTPPRTTNHHTPRRSGQSGTNKVMYILGWPLCQRIEKGAGAGKVAVVASREGLPLPTINNQRGHTCA